MLVPVAISLNSELVVNRKWSESRPTGIPLGLDLSDFLNRSTPYAEYAGDS